MEELVKVAEGLYWQIDKVIWNLIATRTNKDDEGKKKAISDMETAMCGTQQFLKCIIDRKDNIVDLGEVWHSVDEEPDGTRNILIDSSSYVCNTISPLLYDGGRWKHIVNKLNVMRWAYIEDLLPKGGKAWNTIK